jgi:DNA primase
MIDNQSVEQLKDNMDIVDIISNYIEVKKAGANFKANCPFHGEKTPSFVISPAKQIYHCFGCLAPNEEIRTRYGLKEIQDIAVGDEVFASSGKFTKVIETLKHKPQYKMLKFKTDLMNNWSTFTANHDMLIVSKKEAFEKLPYICVEKKRPQKFYGVIKKRKHLKPIALESEITFAGDVKKGDYFLYPVDRDILELETIELDSFWEKKNFGPNVSKIKSVKITSDLMWLFGIYVAEGSTYRGGIKFSLHSKELDYAKRIIKTLKKSFSKNASLFYPKNRKNSLEVTCSSTNLEYIFKELFSKGAENKSYPYYFNYLKKEYRESLLKGLMDGDGCYSRGTYGTVSRTLAYSLVDLAIGLEMIPALYQNDAHVDKNRVNHKKSYEVLFRKRESLKSFFEEVHDVKYLFMRVKEIEDAPKEELVYDITVEDKSHTFLTKSFLVGNCGVGGDAIKFVQEYEKLNYPEALEKIASMMNFSLSYTKGTQDNSEARRVLEQVQTWYGKTLDGMMVAKKYLHDRGINQSSIEKFGIGYVGKSHELMNFLSATFLPLPKAQEAGIIDRRESGGFYARLTERITFPIYSASGAIVGFGGRTITNHPAKYINSPQTKLFNKSQLLYGYAKAKESIYRNKKLIVCEGYLDVVMFHQAGFTEAVATLGTALTAEHLPILRKGEPHIVLAYDGDKAGVAAALKASTMLTQGGFDGSVVLFPNGADPADMIAMGKTQEVANLLRKGQALIPFVIEMMAKSYDLNNPRQKEIAFGAVKKYLDELTPIIREAYIPHASTVLGVQVAFFGQAPLDKKVEKPKVRFDETKDDIGKLSIIKTLMEQRNLIDQVVSVIEPSMFGEYDALLTSVIQNQENSALTALLLDESIKVMSEAELIQALASFLFRHYNNKLKSITLDSSMPLLKKSFLIRKIKIDILPRLKRGELVTYGF